MRTRRLDRVVHVWPLAALAVLALPWLGLSGLFVVARGDPEAFLQTHLSPHSRADAFENISGILGLFWSVQSILLLLAMGAIRVRRSDVLIVLLIGPIIALALDLLFEQWSDPNWHDIVAIGTIGWMVGSVVGGAYWCLKSVRCPNPPYPDQSVKTPS